MDYDRYIHEYNGRFIVAEQRPDGSYRRALSNRDAKITGCFYVYGPLYYVADNGYAHRASARRVARRMYGEG